MRLWSLHPRYLDRLALVGVWREGLLAQKVLLGETQGYKNHPQLERFLECEDSKGAIAFYLRGIWEEARRRGYAFDATKIGPAANHIYLEITRGQLEFERLWLQKKLRKRDTGALKNLPGHGEIEPHPLFRVIPGEIAGWEKGSLA